MAKCTGKLKVKTGEYEKDGEIKARWETIGWLYENSNKKNYIRINKTFNPAGVMSEKEDSSILIHIFPLDGNEDHD